MLALVLRRSLGPNRPNPLRTQLQEGVWWRYPHDRGALSRRKTDGLSRSRIGQKDETRNLNYRLRVPSAGHNYRPVLTLQFASDSPCLAQKDETRNPFRGYGFRVVGQAARVTVGTGLGPASSYILEQRGRLAQKDEARNLGIEVAGSACTRGAIPF